MINSTFLRPSNALPLLLIAGLLCVPLVAGAADQPFWASFFARIMIYAVAASALNLVLGLGGLVSFGHALFLGVGSYAVALPAAHGISSGWVHLAILVLACSAIAFAVGAISLRTSGMSLIMITLAFAQMGYFILVSLKQYGGDDGLPIAATSQFAPGVDLGSTTTLYVCAWMLLVVVTIWVAKLRQSPFGMALRGARQNARRVQAIGWAPRQVQLVAFVFSGVICGLSGMLLANMNAYASPSTLSWSVSGDLIVMVVIGGSGSVYGPLLGAVALLGIEEFLKGYTDHWMVVFGPLIVLMALLGRGGIVGLLERLDRQRNVPTMGPSASAQEGRA